MKAYSVDITEDAERDMLDAAKYIATELQNIDAAGRLLDDAEAAIYSLEEMPLRHALVDNELLSDRGIRFFPVHNYLVFYAVREETRTVVIERFIYGRRDWAAILKGEADS
ncbi:MAG: type II toxin-antitoxin system RelE/ParE family toxin [Oscillospiraceae bacterium]|jgi:toxin ParE1/3/4|nr:type II toxin-antitoxin system RelE/ParE family toxin [Oscillospiraceae bacterium]